MSRFSRPTRRPLVATLVVTAALTTTVAAVLATGASASARRTASGRTAAGQTAAEPTAAKAPAKVKTGSVWIVEASGPRCQSDSFGAHHGFTAVGGAGADAGTWKGAKKLTMTWTTGMDAGDVFTGTWSKTTGRYTGTDTHAGQAGPATLVPGSTGGCAAVTTAPVSLAVPLGSTDTDVAAVRGTGGLSPTGTVHFYVCPGVTGACTPTAAGAVDLGNSTLAGTGGEATASSAPYLAPAAGSYCFVGVYSGDSNYLSASDGSTTDECFTVTSTNTPTVTTKPGSLYVPQGSPVTDGATVTGTGTVTPTGTVTFSVCGPDPSGPPVACTAAAGTPLGSPVTVSGSGATATATSPAFTTSTLGTYCFLGVYSGDAHYTSASDGSTTDECFTVDPNHP